MNELPRERLLRLGPHSLSVRDLVVLIIGSGIKGSTVFDVADVLLSKDMRTLSVRDLQRIKGVGLAQASRIVAALALSSRLHELKKERPVLDSPKKVFDHMRFLHHTEQEHFYGLYVDVRKNLLACHLLFKGTVDATVVHPRDIFRHAIEENASGVVVVHNHPSGDSSPSDEDLQFTRRLIEVGKMMHIPLLDHVIVGEQYWSYVESGF
jgi:DNA repair protein RadC